MSALPFAYAWRWKGGVTWKLTLTKNPNAHRGLEIKELFDHSDLAATVIEQQAEIERQAGLIAKLTRYIPHEPVECRGDKCREPWCYSCFGEESVAEAMQEAADLRAALDAKP